MQTEAKQMQTLTTYQTTDGEKFTDKDATVFHERRSILITLFVAAGQKPRTAAKNADIIAGQFDDLLDIAYQRGVLSSHYGTRNDF